ncbi:MAG: protein translocase subunit SecF [Nitriliruptoraceae bacterium]
MRTPAIDFVGRAPRWAMVSAVLLLAGLASIGIRGLDLSIDFVGGTSYTLTGIDGDVTSQDLREAAEDAGARDVVAQMQLDGDRAIGAIVRMEAVPPGSAEASQIEAGLRDVASASEVVSNFVGPTWGERITRQAAQALIVFLIVIVVYISLRLEFRMAIAAVVALAHDLAITIGVYALVGFSVSPATVIALLTILGYSLYDTVVVFDRVKENAVTLGDPGRRTYSELVNSSMNEVLYRSINTSITSVLPVGALLFIGSQVLGATTLQDLALALFVGMTVGVYSSLFVAGPLLAWMKMREPEEQRRAARVARADGERRPDDATASDEGAGSRATPPEPAAGSPEARAPITTEYVRGQGRSARRRRRR